MASSISSLVKVMTLMNDNAVVQKDLQRSVDLRMVQGMTDPLRVTKEPGTEPILFEDDNSGLSQIDESNTYGIEESTQAFLELAFVLKNPADNKTRKTWEMKFKVPESDTTRCPKLDSIIEGAVKRDSLDEDQKLSRLQNFMLDTMGPLVAALEELRKDEPDPDRISGAIQQALLFLGNASAHFSQIRHTKILKRLNPEVQSLAKDMISLSRHPIYLAKESSKKSRSVWTQSACSREPLLQSLSQKVFLRVLLSNKRGWEEQIPATSLLSTLQSKPPKRFWDLLKDNP